MSNELPKMFKLVVPQGMSEKIQKKLFSLGCEWMIGGASIRHTEMPYLLIENKRIGYTQMSDIFYDQRSQYTEITFKQLMDKHATPKKTDKEELSEEEESERKKMAVAAIEMINKRGPFVIIGEITDKKNTSIQCGLTDKECIKAMERYISNSSDRRLSRILSHILG